MSQRATGTAAGVDENPVTPGSTNGRAAGAGSDPHRRRFRAGPRSRPSPRTRRSRPDSRIIATPSRRPSAQHPDLAVLIGRYFRHVAAEDLPSKPADVIGIVRAHRRLAEFREPGAPRIRVFNPQIAGDEWSAESTVIDLVNDDMPFLVDSVTSALTAAGVVVHRVLHPILDVRRDSDGRLSTCSARAETGRHTSGQGRRRTSRGCTC